MSSTTFPHDSAGERVPDWSDAPPQRPNLFIQATDAALLAALFAVPLTMGGRQPWGQLILVIVAGWAAVAWGLNLAIQQRARWRFTGAEPLLLAGALLIILQFVHLPTGIVQTISPTLPELLPLWSGAADAETSLGTWSRLSLTPAETRSSLATYLSYALLFLVTAQRIERLHDVERLLKWIGIAAAAMAAFGLVQYLTSNGMFFWVYEHPFSTTSDAPKGSFTNRNHFAQFLALGIGPLMWWVLRFVGKSRRPKAEFHADGREITRGQLGLAVVAAALGLTVFAALLSLSRGGTVAVFTAALVCMVILNQARLVSGRLLAGLAGVGGLLCAFLCISGFDDVSSRLENWSAPHRLAIWKANFNIASDFPVLGTGIGSHAEVYPVYLNLPHYEKEFTHAENGYLQVASEAGLAGLALVAIGMWFCCRWCRRGFRRSDPPAATAAVAAIAAGLAANAVHSAGDFVWYVPGCMVVVCILAAAACRLFQIAHRNERETAAPEGRSLGLPGPIRLAPIAATACMALWMVNTQWPAAAAHSAWEQYLLLAVNSDREEEQPGEQSNLAVLKRRMNALSDAARTNPRNARIQLRAAQGCISMFHTLQRHSPNQMSLRQIREAAVSSQFESADDLHAWLQRALGENARLLHAALAHTRQTLRLCPLQGQAYVYLSQLDFLDKSGTSSGGDSAPYLQQAELVRPHDANVLFEIGCEAWAARQYEPAIEKWTSAFHHDRRCQRKIVDTLAPFIAADALIERFQPDREALEYMQQVYSGLKRPADQHVIVASYTETIADDAADEGQRETAKRWLAAHRSFDELGDAQQAERCLKKALELEPNWFRIRQACGEWYFQQQRYPEAAEHLQWCSQQRPNDAPLRRMTEHAVREKHRH